MLVAFKLSSFGITHWTQNLDGRVGGEVEGSQSQQPTTTHNNTRQHTTSTTQQQQQPQHFGSRSAAKARKESGTSYLHFLPPMSVTAMQKFRGVPGVTPDMYELADALRVMGKSELDIQQFLKELVAPFPQPYSHNADVPLVGSKVTLPNLRKAHADEESLAHISGGSGIEVVESEPLPKSLSSKTFRRPFGRTRQVLLCWHGARCPGHRRGRCFFKHREAAKCLVTGEVEIKAELNALWTALRKLAASLMWRTGSALGANAAAFRLDLCRLHGTFS